MNFIEKTFMILMIVISIFNLFCVVHEIYDCYNMSYGLMGGLMGCGGLGKLTLNIWGTSLVIVAQIINIILFIFILKQRDNRMVINICFITVLIIFILTMFIPVTEYKMVNKSNNFLDIIDMTIDLFVY